MPLGISFRWEPPLQTRADKWAALVSSGEYESPRRMMDDVKDIMANYLVNAAPRRTGAYAASIEGERTLAGRNQRVVFSAMSPLSTWIIYGTAPHPIEPVRASALRFEVADGTIVFAKHVDHPGTQPNDFVQRAVDAALPEITDRLQLAGRELMTELRQL